MMDEEGKEVRGEGEGVGGVSPSGAAQVKGSLRQEKEAFTGARGGNIGEKARKSERGRYQLGVAHDPSHSLAVDWVQRKQKARQKALAAAALQHAARGGCPERCQGVRQAQLADSSSLDLLLGTASSG